MKEFVKGAPKPPPTERPAAAAAPQQGYTPPSHARNVSGPSVPLEYRELDLEANYQEPFAVAVYGPAGAGKTKFGVSAPGTVGVVPLNRKTLQTVTTTAKELKKRVILPDFDLIRSSNPMQAALLLPDCDPDGKRPRVKVEITQPPPFCCAKHNGRWAVDRTKQAALDLHADPRVDSILLDGFDILTEDMLTAHFGRAERIMARDRGPLNKEMIELLGALSGKHLVLTMARKQVWLNDKPTNRWDWAGWSHLSYNVNCVCEMDVREDYNTDKHDFRWSLSVVLCQANAALMGVVGENILTDEAISFPSLANLVYPDSEATWE